MTLARLASPALIEMPSFALSPRAPEFFNRSLPARSTKWILLLKFTVSDELVGPDRGSGIDMRFSLALVGGHLSCEVRVRVKIAWEREDFELMAVASV